MPYYALKPDLPLLLYSLTPYSATTYGTVRSPDFSAEGILATEMATYDR